MIERKPVRQTFYFRRFKCVCGKKIAVSYETKKQMAEILKEEGWQRKGKKWYCPDCQKGDKK